MMTTCMCFILFLCCESHSLIIIIITEQSLTSRNQETVGETVKLFLNLFDERHVHYNISFGDIENTCNVGTNRYREKKIKESEKFRLTKILF
jgi:hypothetical protein